MASSATNEPRPVTAAKMKQMCIRDRTGILYEFKQQEEVIRAEAAQLFEGVGDSIDFKAAEFFVHSFPPAPHL